MKFDTKIAAVLLLASAPVMAQMERPNRAANPPPTMPGQDAAADQAGAMGNPTAPPRGWQGNSQDWSTHVQTCRQRSSTYDPATDQYRGPNGQMRSCPR